MTRSRFCCGYSSSCSADDLGGAAKCVHAEREAGEAARSIVAVDDAFGHRLIELASGDPELGLGSRGVLLIERRQHVLDERSQT